MPWQKGKKRKGHINKDGSPHRLKSGEEILNMIIRKSQDEPVRKVRKAPRKAVAEIPVATEAKGIHGATGRPIIEVCPNCAYAYSDGGWCSECGWSAPIVIGRVY